MFELAISIAGLILTLGMSIYAFREIRRTKDSVMDMIPSLEDYIFQDEEGNWEVDQRIGALVNAVGSRIGTNIKQSFFQGMGVNKKIEKGLQSAVIDDVLDSGALGQIGGLADIFLGGKVRDYLKRNPSAINYLMPLLSGAMGGQGLNLKALMGQRGTPTSSQNKGKGVFDLG